MKWTEQLRNLERDLTSQMKEIHENAVKHIVGYLLTTRPKAGREQPMHGLNMRLDMSKGLE
eukprot:14260119-Ditylum_brightwellii.AAC.1